MSLIYFEIAELHDVMSFGDERLQKLIGISKMEQNSDQLHIAVRVILVQILIAIIVAACVFVTKGRIAGYSIMLGALTSIIPTALSSLIAFKLDNQDAGAILGTLYSGAIVKYLLAAVLFAMIIVNVRPLEPLMVLAGLVTTQLAMVFVPVLKK